MLHKTFRSMKTEVSNPNYNALWVAFKIVLRVT